MSHIHDLSSYSSPNIFVSSLATVARKAINAKLAGVTYQPPLEGGEVSFGVLVTLKTPEGEVRAARGYLGGPRRSLVEEVVNAASGVVDSEGQPHPLRATELRELSVEILLLHAPEQIRSLDDLDPARYGILVEQDGRRGFLLPNIDGVATVPEQLVHACETGHLDLGRPLIIYRFDVDRVLEPEAVKDAPAVGLPC